MPMPPERVDHAISVLVGEFHGLFMFCQMLARLHPDHNFLLTNLDDVRQRGLGTISATTVPDATIEGFEFVMEALRKVIITAAEGK